MKLVTWNIQWGKGCDGRVDLARIVQVARAMGDFDVLCLQEVAVNYEALGAGDQPAELASLLPGFTPVFRPAIDAPAFGRAFGNMILSRLPVLQVANRLLPRPAEPGVKTMQRQALEAVVEAPFGTLRVVTTHLEFFSAAHRAAQVEALTPELEMTMLDGAGDAFQRLFRLALLTGAREGDLCALERSWLKDGWLTFTPEKTRHSTGIVVHLPIFELPPLQDLIEECRGRHPRFILTSVTGKPMRPSNARLLFADRRRDAGLVGTGLHLHDARGTVVSRLLDAC